MKYGVVDIGSSSIKLCVYDEQLNCVHRERVSVPLRRTAEGHVEQSATAIREALLGFVKRLRGYGVKLAGITTYRGSVLAWDKGGQPLTDVITWLDVRGRAVTSRPLYRALRLVPVLRKVIRPDSPAVRIKWLLESDPALREEVSRGEAFVGTLSSYVAYVASKRYLNDLSNEALTGLIHPKTTKRLEVVYTLLGIPESVGPEIVDNCGHIGSIEGVDVAALIADQQSAIIGSSCLRGDCLKITSGTGTFVDATVADFTIPGGELIPLVVYNIGGRRAYAIEGYTSAGGSTVEWLCRVGLLDDVRGLDRAVTEAEHATVFVPSLIETRFPRRKGGTGLLYGLSLAHSRSDMVRGVLESLVLSAHSIVEAVERVAGRRSVIRADGGLSNSACYLKLLSTACGRRVERVRGADASGRGVAMLLALYDGTLSMRDLEERADVDLIAEPGELEVMVDANAWRRAVRWA
ncbi:MAG: FGGY-family carbohydrate kinase [Candidatus Caldarchaeales archaeon]